MVKQFFFCKKALNNIKFIKLFTKTYLKYLKIESCFCTIQLMQVHGQKI